MSFFDQTTEYALRAMARLASLDRGVYLRAQDLYRDTGVPRQYLSKIMRRLVLADLVDSKKGHGGGFRLRQSAEDTPIESILAAVDASLDEAVCAFGWGSCSGDQPCPLHPVWERFQVCFRAWAVDNTLADVGPWVPYPQRRR